jgi:peptidyl-prolyl cis-trans isomerase SurA
MIFFRFVLCALCLALFVPPHGLSYAQDAAKKPSAKAEEKPFQLVDRVIAVVNDSVITERELEERVSSVNKQLEKQGTPLPAQEILSRQLLERLVMETLQLQHAKEMGLKLDDQELDRALQRIAQDNKLTVTELRDNLAKDGIGFAKFRDEIRREMTVARVRENEVEGRVTVSESEVETELSQQATRPQGEAEYLAAHILVRIPEQSTTEELQARQARAGEALAALKKGTDFGQVSATYSDAQEALTGGNLGWRTAAKLPNIFVEEMQNLNKGETSQVLKSGNGFHIVRLLDKRGQGAAQTVTQTRARHILIKVNNSQNEADAKQRILQLKNRIDNGGDFAEIAKAFSEDLSASKGGELDWLYPGDTVPEFDRTMNSLQPNQISEPFLTNFGWHILQVLERRDTEISAERNRVAARLGLRQRKADEAYQQWLLQLRDSAYVEYRTEDN